MEELDLSEGPEAKIPTKLVSRPRKAIDIPTPQILATRPASPLFCVGSFAVHRGLVRAPGAWIVEAEDAHGKRLLQLVHVRPVENAADRLKRTHFEQRVLSQTTELLSERDRVVLSHGGVDRSDGTRVLFWALPYPEKVERLSQPLKYIESLDHLIRVGARIASRLGARHQLDRTEPLLSEHLLIVTDDGADLIGAPVHMPAEWLAADMPPPRLAPEEVTGSGALTKLGDIWRLGQTLSALACAFEPVPEPMRALLDRLTASDPKKRIPRDSEAAIELEQVRRKVDENVPINQDACTIAMTCALSEEAVSELIVRSMGDSTRVEPFALYMTDIQEVLGQAVVDPSIGDATIADVSPFEIEPEDTRDVRPADPSQSSITPEPRPSTPLPEKPLVFEPPVPPARTDSVSIETPVFEEAPAERRVVPRSRRWFIMPLSGLAILALGLFLLRDMSAPARSPSMILESPTPGALVVGEDGRSLGELPLPLKGDAVVYIAANGYRPERLVLPSSGTLRFTLDPLAEDSCTAPIPTGVSLESIGSDAKALNGSITIPGALLVRVGGSRAQLLRCDDLQPILP